MFVATNHLGVSASIPMDETMAELRRALPAEHPVIAAVEGVFEEARGEIEAWMEFWTADRHDDLKFVDGARELVVLVDAIDDWRRGIKAWSEVEDVLRSHGYRGSGARAIADETHLKLVTGQ
jgi:hypothetical protein